MGIKAHCVGEATAGAAGGVVWANEATGSSRKLAASMQMRGRRWMVRGRFRSDVLGIHFSSDLRFHIHCWKTVVGRGRTRFQFARVRCIWNQNADRPGGASCMISCVRVWISAGGYECMPIISGRMRQSLGNFGVFHGCRGMSISHCVIFPPVFYMNRGLEAGGKEHLQGGNGGI